MNILIWIFPIIIVYFFLVFVVLRLVVPFMGFKQYLPPKDLPEEIKKAISFLEDQSTNQISYLQAVYDFVMEKNRRQWKHTRFQAATRLARAWVKDLNEIWHTNDFVYCTAINYVVYAMLANSKFFKPQDVKVKYVFLNFVPHQYLQVKVGEMWIDADPAGAGVRGQPLGTHLSFFG